MAVNVIANMKAQVVKEFDAYMKDLMIGHLPNYDKILHKISFIENYSYTDNITSMYEFLMNY